MTIFLGAFYWLCFPNAHAWYNSPPKKSCGISTWSIDLTFANLCDLDLGKTKLIGANFGVTSPWV